MENHPIEELKGIGEKTGKLFRRLGIETTEDLLSYYPRAYDAYKDPVPIGQIKEGAVEAVEGVLTKTPDLIRFGGLQMVSLTLRDLTGTLQVCWYNMPYMRSNLKAQSRWIFRGRVVKKRGRLVMEQPELFHPEDYGEKLHFMQPIYGQTKGLGNKAITKAVGQALSARPMIREYLPARIRGKYQLAEYNFAIEHIHFPADETELLFARKRLVFDEFFMFILGVRRLKESRQDKESPYPVVLSREVKDFEIGRAHV